MGAVWLQHPSHAVQMFRDKIKLSHITSASQAHCRPLLVLNQSEKPNEGTLSVNNTTGREVSLESMQFGHVFTHTP